MGLKCEGDVGDKQRNHRKNPVLIKQLQDRVQQERKKTTRTLPTKGSCASSPGWPCSELMFLLLLQKGSQSTEEANRWGKGT